MNINDEENFSYTYSAKEQSEIESIRRKYETKSEREDKLEQLRLLDKNVTSKATVVALVLGIIGALVMGLGMSLVMTDLGEAMGINGNTRMIIGIIVGIIGMISACLAYPMYIYTFKKEKEKIAPEIIRLTDELMK